MMAHTSYPEMASLLLFGMNNGSRSLFPTGKFFIDHQAGQVQIARLNRFIASSKENFLKDEDFLFSVV